MPGLHDAGRNAFATTLQDFLRRITLLETWVRTGIATGTLAGGDLNNKYPNPGVAKINGVTVPLTGTAWVAISSFSNSWANLGGGFETVGYLKDPIGFVHVKGVIQTGASGTVAFVLPAGFRPGATTFHGSGAADVTPAQIQVAANGNVSVFYSASSVTGLSVVTFLAEN